MRASSSRWLGTRSSSWSPAITHEQCSRIADTAVADVDCRPRDQFNHIALTLVAEGAGQVVDPRSGSRWDNRYVLGTKHGPCESLDQRVSMFASGHTTEQFASNSESSRTTSRGSAADSAGTGGSIPISSARMSKHNSMHSSQTRT